MGNFLEVLVVLRNDVNETVLQMSSSLISEEIEQAYQKTVSKNEDSLYVTTKRYKKIDLKNDMREAMIKGYGEMSQINLLICSECMHLEYEAEHMVERLVCGG